LNAALEYPFVAPPDVGGSTPLGSGVTWLRLPVPGALRHINVWLLEDDAGWTLVDAEKFVAQFLPAGMPEDFSGLQVPLTVATSDLYRRCEVPIGAGPLRPALAASIALPALLRPVVIDDRVLIDGGATNPLPFDHLRGRADVVVAVDISGEPVERRDLPNPWEALVITVLVMANAIIREKLRHSPPDLMLRPNVGIFGTLDFTQASAILRAAEPIKAEVKEKLAALLH